MAIYIDTSLLLSLILEDSQYAKAYAIWENHPSKAASSLIKIESVISLKRLYFLQFAKKNKNWLKDKMKILNELLNEIHLLNINDDVYSKILENDELSRCKSLDAIHIATALIFQDFLSEDLLIGSLDEKFRKICKDLKFNCG